jgi:transcriptional regulator with XRE-family HTH domain
MNGHILQQSDKPKQLVCDVFAEHVKFCKKISSLRKEQGMTQEQLAEKVGIRANNLARIEVGNHPPGLNTLIKIANALGYTVDFVKQ